MTVTYLGHSAFKLKGKTATLLIDPYDATVGKAIPKQNDIDILLCTHSHADHHNTAAVSEEAFLIDGPGEYDVKDVSIDGVFSYHDKKKGAERGSNTIYVIEVDGVTLCHLGDLGDTLTEDQLEEIGPVDILFVPVGGKYTIDADDAAKVISQIEPHIAVPMHYGNEKLGLADLDVFLKEMGVDKETVKTLKVSPDDFSDDESEGTKVIVMEY